MDEFKRAVCVLVAAGLVLFGLVSQEWQAVIAGAVFYGVAVLLRIAQHLEQPPQLPPGFSIGKTWEPDQAPPEQRRN